MKISRLILLLLVGLSLRAAYAWRFPQWGPGGSIPDINCYETLAESLLQYGRLSDPSGHPTAVREPGYPLLLAGLYHITGPSYRAAQALNCLLGAATLILIFLIGAAVFGRPTAWIATAIAALYPQFIFYAGTLERETFQTFLLTGGLWLLIRACRAPSAGRFVSAAAVWALCPLTNSVFLPAGLAAAGAVWWRGQRRGAGLFLAVFLGIYALWPLRNHHVFGRWGTGMSGSGAHLYVGLLIPNDVAGTPEELVIDKSDPVMLQASRLPEAERDRFFYRAAADFLVRHPFASAGTFLGSGLKMWRLYPYPRPYAHDYRLIFWLSLLSDGWIIPLGLLGLFWAGRRYPETDIFNATLLSVTVVYMLFWAIIRYRLPLMPIVILYAAHALDHWMPEKYRIAVHG